jgi:hypothetical protein
MRSLYLLAVVALLAGCWNGGNAHVRLGDVSLGQQFIDLKRALDAGALTTSEYDETKTRLLSLAALCETTRQDKEEE